MPTNEPRAVTLTAEEVAGQKLALLHACEIISHVNAKYPEDMDDADFQKALSILDAAETRGWSLSNKGDHPAKYPISHTIWTDEGKKLRGWRVVGRRGVYWMVAEEVNFTTGEIISWEYLNTIAQCCIQALQENSILAAAEARAREENQTLDSLAAEIREWQDATFPTATAASAAKHLLSEAHELVAQPTDPEEMADIFLLVIAVANKAGVNLAEAAAAKLAKNKARKWGKPNADGYVEHVKDDDAARAALRSAKEAGR